MRFWIWFFVLVAFFTGMTFMFRAIEKDLHSSRSECWQHMKIGSDTPC